MWNEKVGGEKKLFGFGAFWVDFNSGLWKLIVLLAVVLEMFVFLWRVQQLFRKALVVFNQEVNYLISSVQAPVCCVVHLVEPQSPPKPIMGLDTWDARSALCNCVITIPLANKGKNLAFCCVLRFYLVNGLFDPFLFFCSYKALIVSTQPQYPII